jgi:mRNA interferase YafQ
MRVLSVSGVFKRQYKLIIKRGKPEKEIQALVIMLAKDEVLPPKYRDHALSGNFVGYRDCHIQPDWVMIYQKQDTQDGRGILRLEATGMHSDLF